MKFYTVTETADILHLSERSVYEYISQGRLRAAKIGVRWIIKPEWIEAFVDENVKAAG